MRFSDIKVGCIYNVNFESTEQCEFTGKHLAVVLKKNSDDISCIVMPFTSSPRGVGINKEYLGKIEELPSSFRKNDTYAVFNQVKTISAKRFIALKEESNVIEVSLPKEKFDRIRILAIKELTYSPDMYETIRLLKTAYQQASLAKVISLTYDIKKLEAQKSGECTANILNMKKQLREILSEMPHSFSKVELENMGAEIREIFEKLLNHKN